MTIKIPGKIFIGGEYAALKGMQALTVAVNPCFEFQKSSNANDKFHPESPAGKLNSQASGSLTDPYGVGGLGKSTAEFIAALPDHLDLQDKWKVWDKYRSLLAQDTNTPSGVDLLTQITGGYCLTETSKRMITQLSWSFEQLDWVAIVTGNKVKTHEHLAQNLDLDWENLEKLNKNVMTSFVEKKSSDFVESLNNWREFLFESELEASATTELVEFFMDAPGVRAVKGCGALGSDVVLIIYEKASSEVLKKSLNFWNPKHVIGSNQVCMDGVQGFK